MLDENLPLRVICATRLTEDAFFLKSPTGISLKSFAGVSPVELRLFSKNSIALSVLYNQAIEESQHSPAILVFMHDDIWLGDFFWTNRVREGLKEWDVIGLAGNKRRVARQSSWAFKNDRFEWDIEENLSGAVGHGNSYPPEEITYFGPADQQCKLLDGFLMGVKSEALIGSGLKFDENFHFHFYDIDFCRQAEQLNLKMGTISLAVAHESKGNFSSREWKSAYQDYLNKWGE